MADGTITQEMRDVALTRRQIGKVQTMSAIVRNARRLFLMHGFHGVDIRTIARDAGFSTGAVFASFASKAELYYVATGKAAPVGALADAAADLKSSLEAMVEAYREGVADEEEPSMVREALAVLRRINEASR